MSGPDSPPWYPPYQLASTDNMETLTRHCVTSSVLFLSMVWRKGLFGQSWRVRHRVVSRIVGRAPARRFLCSGFGWRPQCCADDCVAKLKLCYSRQRMSVHTQDATQTQIVDNSTLDITLTLVYSMTRRFVHKQFDHYHLLITYGKFYMFG